MCDPVTCEKCRNIAGCKEEKAAAATLSGLYDNTARQIEQLALLKSRQDIVTEGLKGPAEHPLSVENRALKTSIRQLQDQLADLHNTNMGLMNSNRHLTQLLRAIQSITEAAP